MITRYSSTADKATLENNAYVYYLLSKISDKAFEGLRLMLEGYFSSQELLDARLASSDLVRLKSDMDGRERSMRGLSGATTRRSVLPWACQGIPGNSVSGVPGISLIPRTPWSMCRHPISLRISASSEFMLSSVVAPGICS